MAKYIFIYRPAEGFDMSVLPKEQIAKAMQAWGEWLGVMGSAVVDRGDMFKSSAKSISSDGVSTVKSRASGYSIISVENYDAALKAATTCPIIQTGGRVEIYEAFGL